MTNKSNISRKFNLLFRFAKELELFISLISMIINIK